MMMLPMAVDTEYTSVIDIPQFGASQCRLEIVDAMSFEYLRECVGEMVRVYRTVTFTTNHTGIVTLL